jgi:uncharacterized membrane protein YvbJ
MRCQKCGFENESTQQYCRSCGSKVKYTYDEVHVDLKGKLKTMQADQTEEQTRQALVIAICLLVLAITLKILFSGPPVATAVPASSGSAAYAEIKFIPEEKPDMLELKVPAK